jgi:hypothetical protein
MALQEFFGSDPARVTWKIVRGDTSSINVSFLQDDETTAYTTTGWDFVAVAFNPKTDTEYELETSFASNVLTITAPSDITVEWGSTYGPVVAELLFDLQVDTGTQIWTPIVGTISVVGDVGGSL